MSANTDTTFEQFQTRLHDSSREQLEAVLEHLFKESQKALKDDPEPEYRSSCGEALAWGGNMDDAYEAGQDNGIALNSYEVLNTILNNLG